MREDQEFELPSWTADLLQEEPVSEAASRDRIMQAVRSMPKPRTLTVPMRRSRWLRRGLLNPIGSAGLTAMLLLAASVRVGSNYLLGSSFEHSAVIVGDTVVGRVAASAGSQSLRDTLKDTLRIVEFVVRGRGVESVKITGDIGLPAVSLTRDDRTEAWRARVVVPRDALRFAFLVNDEKIIPAVPLRTASEAAPDSI